MFPLSCNKRLAACSALFAVGVDDPTRGVPTRTSLLCDEFPVDGDDDRGGCCNDRPVKILEGLGDAESHETSGHVEIFATLAWPLQFASGKMYPLLSQLMARLCISEFVIAKTSVRPPQIIFSFAVKPTGVWMKMSKKRVTSI